MRVVGTVNNLSKELLDTVPKLKKGEVKTFQMLTGVDVLQVGDDGNLSTEKMFGTIQIPTKDRIYDPKQDKYVDICVIGTYDGEKVTSIRNYIAGEGRSTFLGKVSFTGGNVADEEMYEYLMHCNYNGKNPNRDESITALFEPLDFIEDAKQRKRTNNKIRENLNFIADMSIVEAREIGRALNWDVSNDDVLVEGLETLGKDNPELFEKVATDPMTKIKSEINKAKAASIITYDTATNKILWSKSKVLIATLERVEGGDFLEQFADYLHTAKNGSNILAALRKAVKEVYTESKNTETA